MEDRTNKEQLQELKIERLEAELTRTRLELIRSNRKSKSKAEYENIIQDHVKYIEEMELKVERYNKLCDNLEGLLDVQDIEIQRLIETEVRLNKIIDALVVDGE
jgi:hypothetical protein